MCNLAAPIRVMMAASDLVDDASTNQAFLILISQTFGHNFINIVRNRLGSDAF